MYEVFDAFCKIPTWDTSHPADKNQFKAALEEAVDLPNFSPDDMGRYILAHHSEPIWPKDRAQLEGVVAGLVAEAWAEMGRRAKPPR